MPVCGTSQPLRIYVQFAAYLPDVVIGVQSVLDFVVCEAAVEVVKPVDVDFPVSDSDKVCELCSS